MNIYVDIDETIADYQPGDDRTDYNLATPIWINIDKINELYDDGHKITYYTARGSVSGIDWYKVTKHQLLTWGAKHHKLITGEKPAYDLMICDKTKRIEEI
tara:strand:+ start:171 stop:473 length:303 start_codon:yes stop_codon:yes gene_type:complete